jgi:hypothetical protein
VDSTTNEMTVILPLNADHSAEVGMRPATQLMSAIDATYAVRPIAPLIVSTEVDGGRVCRQQRSLTLRGAEHLGD